MKKNFFKIFLILIFFAALGQQLYKLYFVFLQDNFVDFRVYWNAASVALTRSNVYLIYEVGLNHTIPFNYPPTSLLFFPVFTLFPRTIASLVLLLFSFGGLFLTIWIMSQMVFTKSQKLNAFLLFSICFIQFFPTKFTLTLGQVNLIILSLLTASFYFFQKKRDIFSGFLLGIATLIKIFPFFLIFFFLREKQWKVVLSFLATLFFGLVLTILFFKSASVLNYFGSVGGNLFLNAGEVSYFDQSLNSFLLRLGFSSAIRLLSRIVLTATSLLLFLKAKDKALSYFGLIFSVLIFLPSFAWFHHYVILIPLIMILWAKTKFPTEKLCLVFIYLLTSLHFRNPEIFPGPNIWLYSYPFFGACILWLYVIRKAERKK